jgi:5'-deoxynucleotidase YfbR-like HD superfamily hydrolase
MGVKLVNFDTLKLIRAAARVERMHINPTLHKQTVGEHTFGVLWLAHLIIAPRVLSSALISVIMVHDVPEAITGDVPAPTIHKYEDIRTGLEQADRDILKRFRLSMPELLLTEWEAQVFKFCDRAEFALFMLEEVSDGNSKSLPRARATVAKIRESGVHKCTPAAEQLLNILALKCEDYPQDHGTEATHGWPG